METLVEVIFSIIGLFLYWLLTSGTKNQKKSSKPAPVPPIVPPKIPQKQVKKSLSPEKKQPPITFGDLLRQLDEIKSIEEEKKTKEPIESTTTKENIVLETEDLKTNRMTDDKEIDLSAYKQKSKPQSHIAQLFQQPENIRNAIIMNEILNRRYS